MAAGRIFCVAQEKSAYKSFLQLAFHSFLYQVNTKANKSCGMQVSGLLPLKNSPFEIYFLCPVPKEMFRTQLEDNLQNHFNLQKYWLIIFMLRGKLPVSLLTTWLPSLDEENFPNIKSWWQTVRADAKCLQFQQQLHIYLQKPNLCFPCELWRCTF